MGTEEGVAAPERFVPVIGPSIDVSLPEQADPIVSLAACRWAGALWRRLDADLAVPSSSVSELDLDEMGGEG